MAAPENAPRLLPIARDAWRFIIPLAIVSLVSGLLQWWILLALALLLLLAVTGFFRDPERAIPPDPGLFLSPADGKVISIENVEVETGDGQRERLCRVGIFLSVFNVHVQRAPSACRVEAVRYNPGKFINALNDKASDDNENNMVWMRGSHGAVGVKQIAGIIARRVVCGVKPGQQLAAGERIGLIRFGSRAEAYFSPSAAVRVRLGEKVQGGLTILAEMPKDMQS